MLSFLRKGLVACLMLTILLSSDFAEAKRRKGRRGKARWGWRPDMPTGWHWPPTKAMQAEGQACLAELDAIGIAWTKYPKTKRKVPTPITTELEFGGIKYKSVWRPGPFVMDCHLALTLTRDAAPILRELGIAEVRFTQIHDWRYMYGRDSRRGNRRRRMLSRHASGVAMDIRDFVTVEGRVLSVKENFRDDDGLLSELERRLLATGGFRTVLTPRNDPGDHGDHFHIEARTPGGTVIELPTVEPKRKPTRRNRPNT